MERVVKTVPVERGKLYVTGAGRGAYIAPLSRYRGEQEFLIARGTKYKIVDVAIDGEITRVKLEVIVDE